jgi:hypothetical protein
MGEVIEGLLDEARDLDYREHGERRAKVRYPYFRPARVRAREAGGPSVAALTRDLSRQGVGLVHCEPIPLGEAVLVIERGDAAPVSLRMRTMWCRAVGDGWHISGGEFLGLANRPTEG